MQIYPQWEDQRLPDSGGEAERGEVLHTAPVEEWIAS